MRILEDFDEKKIDAIFAELDQCHLPGAAVGIAIDGKPVYRKGFGLASIELPVVLSPGIRMRIGSVSKPFTCLAYMLLCEDGKAGIDDPIGKHLPELHPVTHNVTARELMGNISGLRDVYDLAFKFSDGLDKWISSADLLAYYRNISDTSAAPGAAFIYNNGNWLILTAMIERITGQSLEQVLWERIFVPIRMNDSWLRLVDTDFLPNSATQHARLPGGAFHRLFWGMDNLSGAGAIVSTIDDMLRWLAHMDAPVIGSPATWATMKTSQTLANGKSTGYALGLVLDNYRGIETLHHPGSALGGNAEMLKVPAAGLDVIVIVNRQDVFSTTLCHKILDECLAGLEPVKKTFEVPIATGVFCSPETGRVVQLVSRENAQFAALGSVEMPVETDGKGRLRSSGNGTLLTATLIGDPTAPTSISGTFGGSPDKLLRVPVEKPNVGAILGQYRSDSTGTEVMISQVGEDVHFKTVGRFGSATYQLEYLANDIWRMKPGRLAFLSGMLSFDSNGKGFHFSNLQTWALFFRRCTEKG